MAAGEGDELAPAAPVEGSAEDRSNFLAPVMANLGEAHRTDPDGSAREEAGEVGDVVSQFEFNSSRSYEASAAPEKAAGDVHWEHALEGRSVAVTLPPTFRRF
jgi:hypothetical protein